MLNNYFTQLNNISMTKRATVVNHLRMYKQAEPPTGIMGGVSSAMEAGKDYAPAVGYGAAGGALAGIPIALLANAVFGKDKGLRGSLRAALMGGLVGGGAGALGGGGAKYMYGNSPEFKNFMDEKINSGVDFAGSLGDTFKGDDASYSYRAGDKLKSLLGSQADRDLYNAR